MYKIRDIASYLNRLQKERVIDYLNTTKLGEKLKKIGKYSNNDSKFESKGSLEPRSEYEHLCDQYGSHVTADTTRICLEDQTFSRFHQRDIPWVWSFFIVERRFRLKLEVQPDKRNDARYKVQVDFKLYFTGFTALGVARLV